MNLFDAANGTFEVLGSLAVWSNVRRILRDKQVRGVNPSSMAFFWLWGIFNLFYYPSLGQWFSFTGGLALVAGNTVWVFLAWRYRKPE
jgi:hypothetical protein